MSSRTTTPSAVGRTQRRRPAGVLLVGREVAHHGCQRVGERLGGQLRACRAAGRSARHAPAGSRPTSTPIRAAARSPYATASPCSSPPYPAAASKACPSECPRLRVIRPPDGAAFPLVMDAPRPPSPSRRARPPRPRRRSRRPQDRRGRWPARPLSSSSNSRSSPRAAILTASPRAARIWRSGSVRSIAMSMMIAAGWWNAPMRFFPSGRSTAGLAPDRRVDLRDERRRHLDEPDAAEVDRGEEPGRIAERTTTDGDERLGALDAERRKLPCRRLDDIETLRRLALRQQDRGRPHGPDRGGRPPPAPRRPPTRRAR